MNHELIHPNWHVVLIHVPLGVFVLGVLIELFAFLYRHSPVRAVARGMIWIGALASLPAAYTGIYALADVVHDALPPSVAGSDDLTWHEARALASGASPDGRIGLLQPLPPLGRILATIKPRSVRLE